MLQRPLRPLLRPAPRLLFALLLVMAAPAAAGRDASPADAEAFARIVADLAAPEMEGRGVGSAGLDRARDYLIDRFRSLNLQPAFIDGRGERRYTQPSEVSLGVRAERQSLTMHTPGDAGAMAFDPGHAFNALGFSGEGRFSGPAVFVGYGVVSPERGYDSYAGLPPDGLRGKVAIAFRYEPMNARGRSRWAERGQWSEAAALTEKAARAAEHGAAALLIIDPPAQEGTTLRTTAGSALGDTADIPVLHARRSVLERVLEAAGRDTASAIRAYQSRANDGELTPDPLEGVTLTGEVDLEHPAATIHNVGGLLPGRGPLADEVIVVGAHYDHLGRGEIGSLAPDQRGEIHHGADDNASGVAGLVLLAQRLKQWADATPDAARRAVAFVAFSGEERGLLGSTYLVNHPDELAFPFERVVAMVNLDMIGRLRNDDLWVFGLDTGEGMADIFHDANAGLGLDLQDAATSHAIGGGASDHAVFFLQRIPSVHLFTGVHEDYHRPSDTADKINAAGGARVVELAARVMDRLMTEPQAPRFDADAVLDQPPSAAIGHGGAYLGVMPDYAALDGDAGAAITGVVPGSPAEAAGFQPGDVIVGWGGRPVDNVRDLTERLAESEPGQAVTVTVERGGQRVELNAELGRR